MNKEEILEKSRKEKRDEGKEYTFDRSRKIGIIGMVIVFCILAVFNQYNNRKETNEALLALFFGYLCFEGFGIYHINRRRIDLFKIILGAVLCVYFFIAYITI